MIWVLYTVEALAASAMATGVLALGLWVRHELLWLPLIAVGVGFLARMGRRVPVAIAGWHGAVVRRIEEREL